MQANKVTGARLISETFRGTELLHIWNRATMATLNQQALDAHFKPPAGGETSGVRETVQLTVLARAIRSSFVRLFRLGH
jgi:hypothetical protein